MTSHLWTLEPLKHRSLLRSDPYNHLSQVVSKSWPLFSFASIKHRLQSDLCNTLGDAMTMVTTIVPTGQLTSSATVDASSARSTTGPTKSTRTWSKKVTSSNLADTRRWLNLRRVRSLLDWSWVLTASRMLSTCALSFVMKKWIEKIIDLIVVHYNNRWCYRLYYNNWHLIL